AQGDGLQIGEIFYLRLRVLNGQHIIIAGLRIDPEAGRDHLVRSEGRDHVVDHLPLVKSELARPDAVHVELQSRVVDILRYKHVGYAFNLADAGGKLQGGVISLLHIRTRNLYVYGGGKSHIQDRIDQTAGLEVGRQLREIGRDLLLDPGHVVVAAHLVIFFQADLDE